jgi:rod shape-determining protein MreB
MTMNLIADRRPTPSSPRGAFWQRRGVEGRGLAIDLGTSTIRIGVAGRIVIEEPCAVVQERDGRILAVGDETRNVVGRNPPGIEVVEPVADGVVTNIDVAEELLQRLLRRGEVTGTRNHMRAVVVVPLVADGLHRRALLQCVQASLPKAQLVPLEAPMAAAVGSDLPVQEAFGTMVIDVGRGITEAAVVSLGTMVTSRAALVGGAAAEVAVVDHVAERHDLEIGRHSAQRIVRFSSETRTGAVLVRGINGATGLPRGVQMTRPEVRAVLRPVIESIAMVAKNALDAAPAALAADVMQGQIVLTGGASKLDGLATAIEEQTGIAVRIRADPDRAVIDGARLCLDGPALADSPYA